FGDKDFYGGHCSPPFAWAACRVSQACRSATGYRTVLRVPLPRRTHGICPSLVSCHKWRVEMPRALAASRGRRAKGEEMLVGIILSSLQRFARRQARLTYPLAQGSIDDSPNSWATARNCPEKPGFARRRKLFRCSVSDAE